MAVRNSQYHVKSQSRQRYCFAVFQASYRGGVLDGLEFVGHSPEQRDQRLTALEEAINICINGGDPDGWPELIDDDRYGRHYTIDEIIGPVRPEG